MTTHFHGTNFLKQLLFAVKNSTPFDAESNGKNESNGKTNEMEKMNQVGKTNEIFLSTIYLNEKISLLLTNYTHDILLQKCEEIFHVIANRHVTKHIPTFHSQPFHCIKSTDHWSIPQIEICTS